MTTTKTFKITLPLVQKIHELLDAGLTHGKGIQEPGQMCVEAAICFAMGLPHSDEPPCVGDAVRSFKIQLNDSQWSSNTTRAEGMRRLAIAQLGSNVIDQKEFAKNIAEQTIRQIVPIALRSAAKLNPAFQESLELAAVRCEKDGNESAARAAYAAADAARAAYAAADAARAAARAAYAAETDRILSLMAEIAVQVLVDMKSSGCEWLEVIA